MAWMFGAGIGFLLGGPLGAIVGGSLQHIISPEERNRLGTEERTANDTTLFVSYLVTIMTKVAMADGRVTKSEVNAIRNFFIKNFGFSGLEMRYVEGLIEETKLQNPDMGVITRAYRDVSDYQTILLLLDVCYLIAASDGHISTQEQHELRFLAETLRINPEEHERIKYKYSGYRGEHHHSTGESVHPKNDDFAVLGIDSNASNEEIKKAYKQMATQYHPDKVAHLGKELVDFANKKFNEINQAYSNIKKARSI